VDFSDTTTTVLADDPASWPPCFAIAGLTYERFGHPLRGRLRELWDYKATCAWLGRQASFESGPYEQAARVFREHGHLSEAEQILMAQRRHAARVDRSNAIWPRRAVSPVLYAIDTVVPLISLNQRSSWYPDTHVRYGEFVLWWLNLATLLGWLLSSIFVLSLARLSRSP